MLAPSWQPDLFGEGYRQHVLELGADPDGDNVELTPADRRAYISYAKTERHKSFQNIDVSFSEPANPGSAKPGAGSGPTEAEPAVLRQARHQ